MKEKPILFSGPMVRAILAGNKTQTRRVVQGGKRAFFPYAEPGDRLWVKETWCVHQIYDGIRPSKLPAKVYLQGGMNYLADIYKDEKSLWMGKTRPSIFMPRWASRITLNVLGVTLRRLHQMGNMDAIAEGIDINALENNYGTGGKDVDTFAALWDSINGKKYPWSSNPWVWVVEFRPSNKAIATDHNYCRACGKPSTDHICQCCGYPSLNVPA